MTDGAIRRLGTETLAAFRLLGSVLPLMPETNAVALDEYLTKIRTVAVIGGRPVTRDEALAKVRAVRERYNEGARHAHENLVGVPLPPFLWHPDKPTMLEAARYLYDLLCVGIRWDQVDV